MKIIVDRFDGDFAVVELEDGSMEDMPVRLLPEGAVQGSVLEIRFLEDETEARKSAARKKMDNIFNK